MSKSRFAFIFEEVPKQTSEDLDTRAIWESTAALRDEADEFAELRRLGNHKLEPEVRTQTYSLSH